jgi:adenosylmethionine-8-amino-7-oxononanoate aminotransferase
MAEYASDLPEIICICGTDTDVGKTVVTAGLLRAGLDLYPKLDIQAIKAVQTGCLTHADGHSLLAPDVQIYQDAAPEAKSQALFTFPDACSPHLAASRVGESLSARLMAQTVLQEAAKARITLLEGAGGLFVPLNAKESLLDMLQLLHDSGRCLLTVLLVTENKLGAINQALLSLEALRNRNLKIAGFISTNPHAPAPAEDACVPDVHQAIVLDNIQSIGSFGNAPCLAQVPYLPDLNSRQDSWKKLSRLLAASARQLFAPHKEVEQKTEDLLEFDRKHLWHPYAPAVPAEKLFEAYKTSGAYIWLRDIDAEYRVVDGISSWWSAIHGYGHPDILKALRTQAERMPHAMFGGLTHAPAVALGKKLLSLSPADMQHVFFADSGSVAVEVALKMAVQYQHAVAQTGKSNILTVCGGYHGDTLGAMSVCDPGGIHALFHPILPRQIFAPRPECRFDLPYSDDSFKSLERLFDEHKDKIAAVILEPVFQGAGGMWFYHPEYLTRLKALCVEHKALLILDEIATGFGRTGRMFASEWAGIQPDIMCVGKGLTGGTITLAATLCTQEVADGIAQNSGRLMHGPTFMANPLACAAANASLDILTTCSWKEQVAEIESLLQKGLAGCKGMTGVKDVRVLGAIGVVEMEKEINSVRFQNFFVRECGVWIRPFGKFIYLMPPYITQEQDMNKLTQAICKAVRELA